MANRVSSNQTIEIPGISIQMRQRICTQADKQHPMTLGSSVMLFKDVEHLLSDKPLRRPSRTSPIGL